MPGTLNKVTSPLCASVSPSFDLSYSHLPYMAGAGAAATLIAGPQPLPVQCPFQGPSPPGVLTSLRSLSIPGKAMVCPAPLIPASLLCPPSLLCSSSPRCIGQDPEAPRSLWRRPCELGHGAGGGGEQPGGGQTWASSREILGFCAATSGPQGQPDLCHTRPSTVVKKLLENGGLGGACGTCCVYSVHAQCACCICTCDTSVCGTWVCSEGYVCCEVCVCVCVPTSPPLSLLGFTSALGAERRASEVPRVSIDARSWAPAASLAIPSSLQTSLAAV